MKRLFAAIIVSLVSVAAFARPTISVDAPNLVGLEEQFNVSFTIDGQKEPKSFEWSPGSDFQLVWGPQKSKSTSVSIINGTTTNSSKTTFTYVLLARKAGTFQLPSASAVIDGETVLSSTVTVQVVQSGAPSSQSGRQSDAAASTGTVSSEDIFLRLILSKNRAVVGEALTATLKIYQRTSLSGFEDVKFPSFDGFWNQVTQSPKNIDFRRETVNGKIYDVALLRSWTLVPQRTGDIVIDPAEIVSLVSVRAPSVFSGSLLDDFFHDDYMTVRKRLTTDKYTVHVSPLPSNAPSSFCGGVGEFSMSASVSRDSLRMHDAASLMVRVTGKGNVALLEAPKLSFPPDFETYDVKVSDIPQGKLFEYPFIPRSNGDFVLGPVEYTYYDVTKGKYVTVSSEEMKVSVSKAAETTDSSGMAVAAPSNRKDIKDLGSDVRYITTKNPGFTQRGELFAGSPLFWLVAALIALVFTAVYFCLKRFARRRADVVGTRSRSATKMARKRLSRAGVYLGKGLHSEFYEELHRTLCDFVADKLGMDIADMSRDNISSRFAQSGVPEDVCSNFSDLLEACEFARYSPSGSRDEMSGHYSQAVSVISRIDDHMRKNRKTSAASILILLAMLLPAGMHAAESARIDSLWNAGVEAYGDGLWSEAANDWTAILKSGQESPELYNNIGNAMMKQENLAQAILNYERALKLDPSFADARYNLDFANARTIDNVEAVPEFFLKTWARNFSYSLSSTVWSVLALSLFAVALAMLLVFLLSSGATGRKVGFFSCLAAFLLSALCLWSAFSQRAAFLKNEELVVTVPVSTVKSSPVSSSVDLFVLHEGTKVKTLAEDGDWINIELSDGRQGWIKASDGERI